MKSVIFTFIGVLLLLSSCKKGDSSQPASYDQLNLTYSTKLSATYDTTYINLKSKFPINNRNFKSSIIYKKISDKEADLTILTTSEFKSFNFQFYLSDDGLANFNLYKKEAVATAVYGK